MERRKKTRCPGERPACSTCTRLKQSCQYSRSYDSWEGSAGSDGVLVRSRRDQWVPIQLTKSKPGRSTAPARGEDEFSAGTIDVSTTGDILYSSNLKNENADEVRSNRHVGAGPLDSHSIGQSASGDAASRSTPGGHEASTRRFGSHDELSLQSANMTTNLTTFTIPPKDMISKCIALYFQYCHKQPLWLFDPEIFSNLSDIPDEVIFGISSLALRYSRRHIPDGQVDQLCRQYVEAAHSLISLRIARGRVNLSTMQALCLIALAEYIGRS